MSIKSLHDLKTFSQQKIEKETVNECLFVMSLSILQLNLFYGISIILLNSQKRESMKLQLLECAVALQTIMQQPMLKQRWSTRVWFWNRFGLRGFGVAPAVV